MPHDKLRQKLAYNVGAIDRSLPFSVLKAKPEQRAAKAANDDPRFSVWISEELQQMSPDLGSEG